MSLWWVKRNDLDSEQLDLIEQLPLRESFLILGPPGCGKTNILLRRAQFVRAQGMPNSLVVTFTRSLAEFVKTGCVDSQGREIFPLNRVTTLESWLRTLYRRHSTKLPEPNDNLIKWKRQLAQGAIGFVQANRMPQYDALFVDEAQDLLQEEVDLIAAWSQVRFFVGDDRQKIYPEAEGLTAVRPILDSDHERTLRFHYRLAPEICRVADRILVPHGGENLESTCHYNGPQPATVNMQRGSLNRDEQLDKLVDRLRKQVRVYAGLLEQGERIGVVVPRRIEREIVKARLSQDPRLEGLVQIVRARAAGETDYNPAIDPKRPICILTGHGCKGLEFLTVHWLFANELSHHYDDQHYYTVVTRAKTSLDVYYENSLPDLLAGAHAKDGVPPW